MMSTQTMSTNMVTTAAGSAPGQPGFGSARASSAASANAASSDPRAPGVLVLGGGIVGLGVAYQLCQAGFAGVTVLAAQLSPNTTSDIAGASIVPYTDSADPEEQARVTRWTKQVRRRTTC
jgi:pyruvate/2-oxoglutarate dehydrogenase complex dihydrolipoamide dehydrogenase (E3) component